VELRQSLRIALHVVCKKGAGKGVCTAEDVKSESDELLHIGKEAAHDRCQLNELVNNKLSGVT